jgi:hypothetical protein
MYLSVSSQNVQTVLDFTPRALQRLGCRRRNCTVDSCTKFNDATNCWTQYLVLYISPKEKIGKSRGPRDWSVPPSPSVWKTFIQTLSHCKAQCGGALYCCKSAVCELRWKFSGTISTVSASTKDLFAPFLRTHHLPLETVPTIATWTVFQVPLLHIPDGNIFALE